jgi:putative endonuclease
MYTVYVLYSEQFDKIYVGFTNDLDNRFKSHNELGKKGWTIKFRPWVILHTESFDTKQIAMEREKQLKSARGRTFIRELVRSKFPNA